MNRRQFVQSLIIASVFSPNPLHAAIQYLKKQDKKDRLGSKGQKNYEDDNPNAKIKPEEPGTVTSDEHISDYLAKIRAPNTPHKDDLVLDSKNLELMKTVLARFQRIVSFAGDGRFCVMSFDEALGCGKQSSHVGEFTKDELSFMEELFYRDANVYGFYGAKQLTRITQDIDKSEIYKVPYSGNYLFKGDSLEKYELVRKNLGEDLILTSGIRGVMKQFYLFISKAMRFDGNLSLASRSLAPPGYSYHATGDFDVGQKGFGGGNFDESFITTSVFKELTKLGYVEYRYGRDNLLGVRYEPWHIKLGVGSS